MTEVYYPSICVEGLKETTDDVMIFEPRIEPGTS
jgi:hypothetical protein